MQDGGDAEPSLAAPETSGGSQIAWLHGNGQDREAAATEIVLPGAGVARASAPVAWGRQSSFIAAAVVALLDFGGVR